ncbi:MAG: Mce-associated rane protein, partial [Mycobacterium sp.]|nr:Mce-associated rane protein [Mycobacterium sp.]
NEREVGDGFVQSPAFASRADRAATPTGSQPAKGGLRVVRRLSRRPGSRPRSPEGKVGDGPGGEPGVSADELDAPIASAANGDDSDADDQRQVGSLIGDTDPGPSLSVDPGDAEGLGDSSLDGSASHPALPGRGGSPRRVLRFAMAASAVVVVVLGGLTAFEWFGAHQSAVAAHQREVFLQAGRQAAIDLTTISYSQADADVARILDSATGTFHDDFQKRSQPFIDVVKKAQSDSQGSVTSAGVESVEGDKASVIVAVSVKTSNAGVPDQQPRGWRMRLNVQKVGDTAKVSDVAFVP